jgi:hypothetical protein
MRWMGLASHMAENRNTYRIWWGNLKEKDHLYDLDVDGRLILKWTSKYIMGGVS